MHTYRKNGKDESAVFTVGFELPGTQHGLLNFRPLRDFKKERDAAAYVSYLNGGEFFLVGVSP
jgi:hypothetical protein